MWVFSVVLHLSCGHFLPLFANKCWWNGHTRRVEVRNSNQQQRWSENHRTREKERIHLPSKSLTYSESKKSPSPPKNFRHFFSNGWEFSPNFTCLLNVPIYVGLQIFIQLPATLTKLYPIKRDHHNVLKMSTIDRNARWVVALNMA